MSTIIKEPFSPPRRHLMIDYRWGWSGVISFCRRLEGSVFEATKLAAPSLEGLCIVVLLLSLLLTTLLLPWIL
jgi:hypothetical protein